jgi:hypothetical protein
VSRLGFGDNAVIAVQWGIVRKNLNKECEAVLEHLPTSFCSVAIVAVVDQSRSCLG